MFDLARSRCYGAPVGILFIILMIGGVILVHELGHYLVARWMGIHVVEFSIGFGPRLFVFKGKKRHPHLPPTEYAIALLPFGGFVKMLGVDPGEEVPREAEDVAFGKKPVWRRFLVMVAGPAFNLALPIVLFFAVALTVSRTESNVVADVQQGYPAEAAGIRSGDRIVAIDGEEIGYWWQIQAALHPRFDQPTKVAWIDVNGARHEAEITPRREERVIVPNVITKSVGIIGLAQDFALPLVGVEPGSPAAQAGITSWDRIIELDGEPMTRVKAMLAKLAAANDRPVTVRYLHYDPAVARPLGVDRGSLREATLPPVPAGADPHRGLMPSDCVVWQVVPGSPAAELGLRQGDQIVSFDKHTCDSWRFAGAYLDSKKGKEAVSLVVRRDGKALAPMQLAHKKMPWPHELDKTAQEWIHGIVVQVEYQRLEKIDNDARFAYAFHHTGKGFSDSITQTLSMLGGLFTGKVEMKDGLGGPVAIAQLASKAGEEGWDRFFALMGAISISIGLVNLLPIPILDGGQILFLALEGIRRRPVSMRTRMIAIYASLAFIVILMILVIRNDVARIAG